MYTLCNLPKLVLRLNLRKLDYLRGKIFWNFSFVELTWDDLTQLGRNNTWKGIFLPEMLMPNISIYLIWTL